MLARHRAHELLVHCLRKLAVSCQAVVPEPLGMHRLDGGQDRLQHAVEVAGGRPGRNSRQSAFLAGADRRTDAGTHAGPDPGAASDPDASADRGTESRCLADCPRVDPGLRCPSRWAQEQERQRGELLQPHRDGSPNHRACSASGDSSTNGTLFGAFGGYLPGAARPGPRVRRKPSHDGEVELHASLRDRGAHPRRQLYGMARRGLVGAAAGAGITAGRRSRRATAAAGVWNSGAGSRSLRT
mmetsp:Transcript_114452/g.356435  ORF Transcript_114452/g.356435 Transcript_114452/m.356435 type:complete len:242 (-) Transcript_114452:336-1061(-)